MRDDRYRELIQRVRTGAGDDTDSLRLLRVARGREDNDGARIALRARPSQSPILRWFDGALRTLPILELDRISIGGDGADIAPHLPARAAVIELVGGWFCARGIAASTWLNGRRWTDGAALRMTDGAVIHIDGFALRYFEGPPPTDP